MPKTTEELILWFENTFNCFVGPAVTQFRVPNSATTSYLIKYAKYGVATKTAKRPEELLVKQIYDAFLPISLMAIDPVLFWRTKPTFEQKEVAVFGRVYGSGEDVQDGLVLPLDAVQDFDTGTWRQSLGTELVSTLQMRLSIPALNWCQCNIAIEIQNGGCFVIIKE